MCGRLPGDGGSIPRRIAAGSGSWIVTPGDPDAKPLPQRAAAKIEREEMRFLTPAEIVDLAEAIHARYRALVFVGAYGGLRMGELAGLRRSRVDLLAGAVTVAETPTEVKGKLIAGPPKTRAGRRTVGLPPFVVRELKAHLAAAQRPSSHVFTAPGGGPLRVPSFRARSWLPATEAAGLRIHDLRHTAVALWIAAGATPKEVAVRGGTPRSASPWTATATRRSPGRSQRAGAIQ
jgi:integrase